MGRQERKPEQQTTKAFVQTPIGLLMLEAKDEAICAIGLVRSGEAMIESNDSTPLLEQAKRELTEYFAGKRTVFTFPMRAEGTPFQKSVWDALVAIPFGETKTYGEIAKAVSNPKGSRAVGMACNKNPIMIAVPCHRVLGAGGSLTGYAGGLPVKQTLLKLEQGKG